MKTLRYVLMLSLVSAGLSAAADRGKRPNFVVIMGEAQGWASMSVPLDDRDPEGSRSSFVQTPNLDKVALRGMRFSNFYAASPRCTPTRAALFTGVSPARLRMTFVNEGKKDGTVSPGDKVVPPECTTELPRGILTTASLLKSLGYSTAHFGKWHCGRANPSDHGFDENDGPNSNGGPDNVEDPNPKQCYAIAKLGVDFMRRQVKAGQPFFLQLSEYPGRGPQTALPETVERVKRRLGTRMDYQRISLAAGNEEVDTSLGLVFDALRELGVEGETYVIYTADHGAQGQHANGALSQGKGTVREGGLRVPLLIAGPGVKAGAFCHEQASTVDVLPTMAALAGVPVQTLPKGIEGVSLAANLLQNPAAKLVRPREELVVHFPHYDKDEAGPASAIIMGRHKLIRYYEKDERELYDLAVDPGEEHNLAARQPDLARGLEARMMAYLASVGAGLPKPNPDYNPAGERSGDRKGGKGAGGKGGGGKGGAGKGGPRGASL